MEVHIIVTIFLFHSTLRFGDGYTVKVWLHKEANQHNAISDCLKLYFPGIQFKVVLIFYITSLFSAKNNLINALVFFLVLILCCQKILPVVLSSLQSIGHTSPPKLVWTVDIA